MKLSSKRYEEIKKKVVEMFVNHDISSFPISSFKIADKMGIELLPYSKHSGITYELCLKESEDGFYVDRSNKVCIYYNEKKCFGRISYTIMHEIGHIILDHKQDSELAEKEVNFFAKYALAPPVLIHELGLNNPTTLKKFFEVSDEVARYALEYYNKWLKITCGFYSEYELQLVELFTKDIRRIKRIS